MAGLKWPMHQRLEGAWVSLVKVLPGMRAR